ncbi:MAG: class SAM-dependent methyltransferase [Rickettsiaceae bacterium]|jgi:extracellular factor (EF) 3-hydroxypalmitic acid methyl ester biosynthesis protein|nr:class SAM-dependent methyltransferase [Rickettsiaceae bacterium]
MTKSISEIADFITFKSAQGVAVRGTLLKISQNQIVFETYNLYSLVQLSEVLNNVTIYRFNKAAYVGKAVVSNLINTGLLLIVSATLVDPWLESIKPGQLPNIEDEAEKFVSEWNQISENVLPDYQLSVNKMRSFLTDMSRWVRQFDAIDKKSYGYNDEELINKISEPLLSNLAGLLFGFEVEAKKIDKSQLNVCKRFAQTELHPLMMQSPFAHRTFSKPLGYAGDYEMVNMMLRNPYEGETIYAKLFNLFLLKAGPAEAHRNRIDILLEKIKETAIRAGKENRRAQIFNFACGPAAEIQRFIATEEISENCDFILLDFSKETLDYTSNIIEQVKRGSNRKKVGIRLINKSVNDILKNAIGLRSSESESLKDFDLVYCAGLFDYLSDRICTKLLGLFFSQLKTNGELLVTNVHSNNPVKALMEHLLEWYLIYRDEESFSTLIEANQKKIYTDKTGFNIFLEAKKS